MEIYDKAIEHLLEALPLDGARELDFKSVDWPEVGDSNLLLRADMAYELGGSGNAAVSAMAVTTNDAFVGTDEVLLIGPDLQEIKEDCSYARIALIKVKENSMGDGNALYNAIRKIEYVRYHVSPKGYMTRISANNGREPVRVGREAISEGLSFAHVGRRFIETYHENDNIEAVKLIFITDKNFDYKEIASQSKKLEEITGTIDHIFKNIIMECGSCSLKPICDEVEGLKELHFSQMQNS